MNHEKFIRRQRIRRKHRVRKRVRGIEQRPRLCVTRTHKHLYCQIIDDFAGRTLVSASTLDKDLRGAVKNGANKDAATVVGQTVAKKALDAGIKAVCFDRGSYKFHGRVKALADAVRESGVAF